MFHVIFYCYIRWHIPVWIVSNWIIISEKNNIVCIYFFLYINSVNISFSAGNLYEATKTRYEGKAIKNFYKKRKSSSACAFWIARLHSRTSWLYLSVSYTFVHVRMFDTFDFITYSWFISAVQCISLNNYIQF